MSADIKPEYGKMCYWDERYKKFFSEDIDFEMVLEEQEEESPFFDWYRDWDGLSDKLKEHCKPGDEILMLGCGNSGLSKGLYEYGCHNILNVDVSDEVVGRMKELHDKVHLMTDMRWVQKDATKPMDFLGPTFDIVIDKGCFDAILVVSNPNCSCLHSLLYLQSPEEGCSLLVWQCGQNAAAGAPAALMEVSKALLKKGSKYIVISHAASEFRLGYFDNAEYDWDVAHTPLTTGDNSDGGVHYLYVMTKKK